MLTLHLADGPFRTNSASSPTSIEFLDGQLHGEHSFRIANWN